MINGDESFMEPSSIYSSSPNKKEIKHFMNIVLML